MISAEYQERKRNNGTELTAASPAKATAARDGVLKPVPESILMIEQGLERDESGKVNQKVQVTRNTIVIYLYTSSWLLPEHLGTGEYATKRQRVTTWCATSHDDAWIH